MATVTHRDIYPIMLKNPFSEETKSSASRKFRKNETSQILVVLTNMQPMNISNSYYIYIILNHVIEAILNKVLKHHDHLNIQNGNIFFKLTCSSKIYCTAL